MVTVEDSSVGGGWECGEGCAGSNVSDDECWLRWCNR